MKSVPADTPLISVVMPVYNAEAFLTESIHSILSQTYHHFELIIIDDGSTDGSINIINEFAKRDARICPIFSKHGGAYFCRNIGIKASNGEFIAYMDADDVSLPERFAVQLELMRKNSLDVCGSCARAFGDSDRIWWFPEKHEAICKELVLWGALLHPTVILKSEIAKKHLYHEALMTMGDYEMWTRLAPLYRMGNVPQILHKWRSHQRQTHVVLKTEGRSNIRNFLPLYYRSMFPQATQDDYAVLAYTAEKIPFHDLAELERAGLWLIELSNTTDWFLRKKMAGRWRSACQRSSHLGLGCYRLYKNILRQFGDVSDGPSLMLWFTCALRIKSSSKLHSLPDILKKIRTNYIEKITKHGRQHRFQES